MKKRIWSVAAVVVFMVVLVVGAVMSDSNKSMAAVTTGSEAGTEAAATTSSEAGTEATEVETSETEEKLEGHVIEFGGNIVTYELEEWSYRSEVENRLDFGNYEISDEEYSILKEHWYSVDGDAVKKGTSVYYYPVLAKVENSVVMYYTNSWGDIYKETISGQANDFGGSIGNLHSKDSYNNEIHCTKDYLVKYDPETGYMTVYQFDNVVREYFIGKDAVYTGKSEFEGYIFRKGTDVYAVRYDCICYEGGVMTIAHDVAQVILADYDYSSDGFSQPLFLMTDGTLKVYGGPAGETPDDVNNLYDIRYEGGYDR